MITFLYKNKLKNAVQITENEINSSNTWGTKYIIDDDINSAFRAGDYAIGYGTTSVLFNFGSAVYMDSVALVCNLTITGTCWLSAGTSKSCLNITTGIPIDGLGTSYKYFGNFGYQYWKINMQGVTTISTHQINEMFLGQRKVISEMPSYPFDESVEENTVELTSEKGQKWIYSNYERENWIFNFEGVNKTTENDLFSMYKYLKKNTTPFWMLLYPDSKPLNIKFVRFKDQGFLSDEITKYIFDLTLEVEREV